MTIINTPLVDVPRHLPDELFTTLLDDANPTCESCESCLTATLRPKTSGTTNIRTSGSWYRKGPLG
jgi:hypothetical protein